MKSFTLSVRGMSSALLAAGWLAACAPSPTEPGPFNVILVCMDTVRADRLGCYGYEEHDTTPVLDRLAADSIVFVDVTATAGWTKPSVPSFLTGTFPAQHGVYEGSARDTEGSLSHALPERATTLAEMFRTAGYRTAAFVHNAQLRKGLGFEQGFEVYDDEAGDARDIRWRALDWLDASRDARPFFLYLHFLDAHWPYDVPDEYATMFASAEEVHAFQGKDSRRVRDDFNHGALALDDAQMEALLGLYAGSIRFIDSELGRLLAGLEQRGLSPETVLSVLSDHGEEFGEHGRLGHGHGLYQNLLRVPWILHVPERAGLRSLHPISLVDVFPTLLASAGLDAGDTHVGTNRLESPELDTPLFAEHKAPDSYMQALRDGDTKVLRSFTPPRLAPATESAALPTPIGTRWEAELARDEDGSLFATQLKPRDEPPSSAPELKGVVTALAPGRVDVEGFALRRDEATELALDDGATGLDLEVGAWVKVQLDGAGGDLRAGRIKLYAPSIDLEFELRGTVTATRGSRAGGFVYLAGTRIRVDARTVFKDLPADESRMTRAQVEALLAGGAALAVDAGYSVESLRFDLARPGEPSSDAPPPEGWPARMDRLGEQLYSRRVFTEADTATLAPADLAALRAIGYAD